MSDSLKLLVLSDRKNTFSLVVFSSAVVYFPKSRVLLVPCRVITELVSLDIGDVEFAQQPQRLST